MDRDLIGPLLERLVAPGGVVLVCSARSAADGRNGWLEAYDEARRFWSGARTDHRRYRSDLAAILAGTRFHLGEPIAAESSHELSARDLASRMLTFSGSSPAVLGNKVNAMLHDVERRLLPFSRAGLLKEVVIARADVASTPPRER
ncbi:hypothetical protein [Bradyrhizobium jicamae]|uniref:hypothetical protein n=1 Tax=Bradyrhizobium jicamae TaxID=280332 RepID=UPI001FD93F59|nr:hypothetical protein [Bradyrhizobium jicamae]